MGEKKRAHRNNLAFEDKAAARQGDMKTLYNLTKKISGRLWTKERPVRNRDGTLIKTITEELKRWKDGAL